MNYLKKSLGFLSAVALTITAIGCDDKIAESDSIPESSVAETTAVESAEPETTTATESDSEPLASPPKKITYEYGKVFSSRDLNPEFDNITAEIALNGDSASCKHSGVAIDGSVVTITQEGIYRLSGKLDDGQIIVNAPDAKVQLILDNADITCSNSSAIYGVDSKKIFVSLAENSVNSLTDGENYTYADESKQEPDACIFSGDSLTINGSGTLNINSSLSGIHGKDDIVITGGNINITSDGDGIKGKDYVAVADGNISIESGEDGIKSTNTSDSSLGYVYIQDGGFSINSAQDGIQAETDLIILDGNFDITSGGGSENSTKTHSDDFGGIGGGMGKGFGGGRFNDNFNRGDFGDMSIPDDFNPQDFENMTPPDGFNQQDFENMTPPDGFNQQDFENMTPPDGFNQQDFENMTPPDGFNQQDFENMTPPDGFNQQDFENMTPPEMQENQTDTTTSTVSTKGLKGGSSVNIIGGEFTVNSASNAVHSENVVISGDKLTLTTGNKGIHADSNIYIDGGEINITNSYEGIEGAVINVSGGDLTVNATDDGFNASDGVTNQDGMGTYSEGVALNISGGNVYVNADGDGLDSNGDMTISGGTVIVDGPTNGGNGALDGNNEIVVTGGTLIAVGISQMAECPGNSSTQYTVSATFDSTQQSGTSVKLVDENGGEIISFTSAKTFDNIIISSPDILKDKTYTFYLDDSESESFTASEIISTIGRQSQMGGGFGGMGGNFGGRDKDDFQPPNNENGESNMPDRKFGGMHKNADTNL
ncbi:MAG: carbohydrate-binding domain-containing protein [Ruminococcus flavefaciens]|nr:carbohydrate-binding domain-containing protein [Ruminococcus flavefaciens]MCM1229487.1 carbohydrate-binding domain-containing protein [Ruminococcus flavefaciens]